ncbi:glycosyltransferase family 4 protein [bacterium]|nr:glycosyltransferase family 4 protein [bacterium]
MNKGQKILIFYQYFGTPKGSWSTRIYELAKRWTEKGCSVTVVTTPYEKSDIQAKGFISHQEIDGINLIVVNCADSNRFPLWKRAFRALSFALVSIYYALKLKYDVLLSSSGPITVGLPLVVSKRFRKKRYFFEVRDLWPEGGIEMGKIKSKPFIKLSRWFEKLCYSSSHGVITASIGQEKFILNKYPGLNTLVIPNASDLSLFGWVSQDVLPEWTRGKSLFTHIGSLGFIHNMSYWMEVAEELKKQDPSSQYQMVFIGDGAERTMLEEWKVKSSLENVHFLGLMPKNKLPIWVQSSVATLFATLDNPVQDTCSPNKIFDSFAAGVPIVQTSNGWIKELVNSENCGINISLKDPKQAAEAMIELATDTERLKLMQIAAKRLAEGEFNRSKLADKYLEFILND